ncbi:PTS glucose transporter subunit IIA [Clostridium sp. chh4-2]|uniref:PTS transporter subunit IIABC n=1 Tax=Clostridium sp. chh4-2 TaxID=2067550 RepID=UPI000CCF5A95|nr:PTS transporter subunit IIABC [Clostridium sp. chh4-2]PNV60232.1 PTS glucose transporter subunit IIA [Clostridium sp. chh4-2]
MKDKIFGVLQRVGRSFMLPIAILPVAGLLLGIGGSFTNATMISAYHLEGVLGEGTLLNGFLSILNSCGSVIFDNLPLLFAIGVAVGMARQEKEVAALASVIAFFIMHTAIHALLMLSGKLAVVPGVLDAFGNGIAGMVGTVEQAVGMLDGSITKVLGISTLQMGVFGGIIVGLGVAALHNKYYNIQLPQVLSFFGGTRFVPIISSLVYIFVGILMYFIWPVIQSGIYGLGALVNNSGYAGTWIYGIIERALIPFGLHHVFYIPFWQTAVGGQMEVAGQMVYGAQNIFFAQLANVGSISHFSVSPGTRFMTGKFPFMIFGLPGAALAMYRVAKPEKKKAAGGLLVSAALTAMLTGITEPIEFTFLFVAPFLYAIHSLLAGASYMIMHMLNVGVGMTFSGGIIDLVLFGILPGAAKTSWYWIPVVGAGYFVVYYFLFKFLIVKFNLKTPGRDDNEEVKLYVRSDVNAKKQGAKSGGADGNDQADERSVMILNGLGGKKNVADVDCCITRLRCTVNKPELVDEALLKRTGAAGVIRKGQGIQVVYGPTVPNIKANLVAYMKTAPNEEYHGVEETKGSLQTAAPESAGSCEANPEAEARKASKPCKAVSLYSPFTGKAQPIDKAPDVTFAQKMIGDGYMVIPSEGVVTAPCDGTVVFVFPTKHAVGLKMDNGMELMLHIGIDTVKLDGQGFDVFVKEGDSFKKGDRLMAFDLDYIKEHAVSEACIVIFTAMEEGTAVKVIEEKEVRALDHVADLIG